VSQGPSHTGVKGRSQLRTGIAALCAALLLAFLLPSEAGAQKERGTPRVAYLGGGAASLWHAGFEEGLRNLGYEPGRNITIDYRWYEGGGLERAKELASDIMRSKPDIIVTAGPPGALAAKAVTSSIPVVFAGVLDPMKAGLVASLARPTGNMTGLAFVPAPEFIGKGMQLFREAWPKGSRVALLRNPDNPGVDRSLEVAREAARILKIEITEILVRRDSEIDIAFDAIRKGRSEALLIFADPVTVTHHKRIVQHAMHERLPVLSSLREFVDAGALMSYGPSLREHARRAAHYVDKILKGAKPADLPVEQPTKLELVINLKTANSLGLTIPQSLRVQADVLIE